MRKIIDAHVHIVPARLLGQTDPRFQVTIEAYGVKRFADGSVYQFMPDYLTDSSFATDMLLKSMENMGVEKAVIMQSPSFSLNEDVIKGIEIILIVSRRSRIIESSDEACMQDIQYYALPRTDGHEI